MGMGMLELSQGFMYRVAHGPEHPRLAQALLLKAEFVLCFTRTTGMVWALLSCLMATMAMLGLHVCLRLPQWA